MKDFFLKLLGGRAGQAILKARDYVEAVEESDEALQAVEVGAFVDVDLPDDLDAKFRSRSGKRFSIDGVRVKRLK